MRNLITLSKSFLILAFLSSIALQNSIRAQPVLEWAEVYAWTGNSGDKPVEMALSDSGYIYIGGQCAGGFLTLKYDADSNLLWDRVHLGVLRAIAIDKWGNAVVTGSGAYASNYTCISTQKYASSNGATIWSKIVEPLFLSFLDSGWDVDVDSTGNSYVTGWIWNDSAPFGTGSDWMTISYQPSGVERWRAQFNGTDSTGDRAQSIAVSPGGNVYYTGSTTSDGYKLRIVKNSFFGGDWSRIYDVITYHEPTPKIVITEEEDVYVTSQYGDDDWKDAFLIKHDSSGHHEWTRTYNGPDDLEDYPVDLAVDSEGNVLVLCFSQDANNLESMTTLKYSPEGDTLWIRRHQYQYGNVEPKALAIDSDNNVYVLGEEAGFYLVKYDSNGNEQWVEQYSDADYAVDIALDMQNNIYITGTEDLDMVTVKYSQVTAINESESSNLPDEFNLSQNYPNPFNPTTKIRFEIPAQARNDNMLVTLRVYDVLGNEVATLVNEEKPAGSYELEFDAEGLTSGIYFYQLRTGPFIQTKKMLMIK